MKFDDYMTYCQADLLGLIWNETVPKFDCNSENIDTPREKSYGCYQIRLDMPSRKYIKVSDAKDLFWSSAWTISRLVTNGWVPRTVDGRAGRWALKCHNGCEDNFMTSSYTVNAVEMSNFYIEEYNL